MEMAFWCVAVIWDVKMQSQLIVTLWFCVCFGPEGVSLQWFSLLQCGSVAQVAWAQLQGTSCSSGKSSAVLRAWEMCCISEEKSSTQRFSDRHFAVRLVFPVVSSLPKPVEGYQQHCTVATDFSASCSFVQTICMGRNGWHVTRD